MTCQSCFGTGRNRRGGPCTYCRGTGQATGLAAAGSTFNEIGRTINAIVFSVVALVVLIIVIVGLLS